MWTKYGIYTVSSLILDTEKKDIVWGDLEIKTLANISKVDISTGPHVLHSGRQSERDAVGSSGGQPQHQDKSASSQSHQQSSL